MPIKKNALLLVIILSLPILYIVSFEIRKTKTRTVTNGLSINNVHIGTNSAQKHDAFKDIDTAWDNIESGDRYAKSGDMERAIQEYKHAYSMKVASRSVSGILLAETYEKTSRYEEGIKFIDEMIGDGVLNKNGIRRINELKSRLLTAKAQSATNSRTQNSRDT